MQIAYFRKQSIVRVVPYHKTYIIIFVSARDK